jgi:hypothetical protein
MKMRNLKTLLCILMLGCAVSVVSAQQNLPSTVELAPSAEVQAVGGADNCMRSIGLGLALAAAALSPCGVVCASLAWYDLMLVAVYCG